MGYAIKKTEHSGAKHGNGAYWGLKRIAKAGSRKIRRRNWKREVEKSIGTELNLDKTNR